MRHIFKLLAGFLSVIIAACVLFAPVYWAFTKDPWYLLLMFVSWIPAILIFRIGILLMD